MTHAYEPLIPADAAPGPDGVPYSARYGDIYHSAQGALAQAAHVFLGGNGLPGRWAGRRAFCVCETGFGLGLNFLALWQAWREDPARPGRLHVVSLEAHPFAGGDLRRLLEALVPAALRPLAGQLAARWPPLVPGLHRLEFEGGALTLTLGFGRAQKLAPQLGARVDAYFLDGFAPDRNPEMWSEPLMRDLARLAAPGATAATWSSAGAVRRALAAAGFAVARRPGFGAKRDMTVAVHEAGGTGAQAPGAPPDRHHALVIGAGPAGAGVAHALALRGWRATVVDPDPDPLAGAHAGHAAAAVSPLVARDDNPRARLARAASLCAAARWAGLPGEAAPLRCGTLQLARAGARRADLAGTVQALGLPETWVRHVDARRAGELAGLPLARDGIFFPAGMRVRPPLLLDALLRAPGIRRLAGRVERLEPAGGQWRALDAAGAELSRAPVAVVANAAGAAGLLAASGLGAGLPGLAAMHALAGEITLLPAAGLGGGPRCIVGGDGYLLPRTDGYCVAGSTYVHGAAAAQVTPGGRRGNVARAGALLGRHLPLSGDAQELPGWAGWRAVLPGRLPAVGALPGAPGLWLATGYASRGLSWSALAGEIVACALEGEPAPLERDLLAAIAPR